MVNKKTNKGYCGAYRQKKGYLYKAKEAARKKKLKEEEENIYSPKTERSLPSSPRKNGKVIGILTKKISLRIVRLHFHMTAEV